MNGYEFQHRVLSPWSRDPGFYNDVIATFAWGAEPPLEGNEVAALQSRLGSVSDVVQQAKGQSRGLLADRRRPGHPGDSLHWRHEVSL